MQIQETSLPGVFVLEPTVYEDERGFFYESYHRLKFADLGIDTEFVQDNHSRSVRNTLRGLHYQLRRPQAKLCRVTHGEVLDVAVDIRRDSPTFGQWVGVILSAQNKRQIFIPKGFAHGYLVLSDTADFMYKCDEFYIREDDRGIAWNDPEIGIVWQTESPLLSEKDGQNQPLWRILPEELPMYNERVSDRPAAKSLLPLRVD